MSRVRLRYVQQWVDRRDGRVHRYVRRPGFAKVRLPGLPGSAEFMAAYEIAVAAAAPVSIGARRNRPGSLSAAIALYFGSLEFHVLAAGTQVMRRSILQKFRAAHGDKPLPVLPQKFITHELSKMRPHAARNWLGAIRALLQFAKTHGLCAQDATQGIKLPAIKTDGYHTWSEQQIAQFEAHHPIGSKPRLALALLLFTAQRRGDVIRMGRQHLRDCQDERLRELGVRSELTVRQQKTGTPLEIPVHPHLQTILDATPSGHLTFLVTDRGEPFGGPNFSNTFRDWCNEADLPKQCTPHGLRKAACRRLAEAGCGANEIMSHSGHATLTEVTRYTKQADQRRMARNAMARGLAGISAKPENETASETVHRSNFPDTSTG